MRYRFEFHSGDVEVIDMDAESVEHAVNQHVGSDTSNLKDCTIEPEPKAAPEPEPKAAPEPEQDLQADAGADHG